MQIARTKTVINCRKYNAINTKEASNYHNDAIHFLRKYAVTPLRIHVMTHTHKACASTVHRKQLTMYMDEVLQQKILKIAH